MDTHTEHRVWKTTSPYPFEAFGAGLAEYTATGKPPAQGNQDVRYALRLQKERLESRSLLMKYEFTPRGHFADASGPGREWRDDLYTSRMEYRTCRMTRSFCRTQSGSQPHRLYEKSQNYIFYQTITDANHYDSMEDEPYVCPSCGAPGRIGDLESGCPYCGTFFQMSDLFPKTTSFYFVEDVGGTQTEVKGSMKTTMRLCMAVFFLVSLFHKNHQLLFCGGCWRYADRGKRQHENDHEPVHGRFFPSEPLPYADPGHLLHPYADLADCAEPSSGSRMRLSSLFPEAGGPADPGYRKGPSQDRSHRRLLRTLCRADAAVQPGIFL